MTTAFEKLKRPLLFICAAVTLAGPSAPAPALADDSAGGGVRLQAGGFVGIAPQYEGSKDYRFIGAPFIAPAGDGSMDSGTLQFRGPDDLRLRIFNYGGFEAGPLGGWRFARNEDDSDRLLGLGDVSGGLVLGGYAAYHFGPISPFVSYHHSVSGSDDTGGVLRFGSEAKAFLTPGFAVTARAGASYADDKYMDTYFSVTPAQSAASVARLQVFDAQSGIKDVFFGLSGDIPLTHDWSFKWSGTYARLIGDAADSPVVESENQFSGGIGLTYTFNTGF